MSSKNIVIEGKTLPIREFKLDYLCNNPSIALIASRGSGKSWICRELLKYFTEKAKIPAGVIISKTEDVDPFYSKFFPGAYIHGEYKQEILERVIYRQKKIKKKKENKKKKGKKIDTRVVIVMDDCMSDGKTWSKDPLIYEVLFNGRHYDLSYIVVLQDPLGVGVDIRNNFDYIFLLGDDSYNNQKRLHIHYAGMFPTLEGFRAIFTELTDNFGCMVIQKRKKTKNLWDKVFWFRAEGKQVKKFGSVQFQLLHEKNYDEHWDEKDNILNMNNLIPQKRGSKKFNFNIVR